MRKEKEIGKKGTKIVKEEWGKGNKYRRKR